MRRFSLVVTILLAISFILPFAKPQPAYAFDWSILFPWLNPPDNEEELIIGDDIISLRQENSKTYQLSDSKWVLEVSTGAIHYKDNYYNQYEQWKDIDTTIVNGRVDKAPYTLVIDTASKSIYVRNKRTGAECAIALNNLSTNGIETPLTSVSPIIEGNTVTWNDIATDTDLVIEAGSNRIRFKRILKSDKAPNEAEFDIIEAGKSMLSVEAVDGGGKLIEVTEQKADGKLTESISLIGREFPIEIDPALTIQPSVKDNFIADSTPATNYGGWAQVRVEGSNTNISRALLEFDISAMPAGATILSANMSLYYYAFVVTDPVGRTYNCYRVVRRDWVESESTWDIYKAASNWSTAGCGDDGNDYTSVDGVSQTVPALNNWMSWNVTDQIVTAYAGGFTADFRVSDNIENDATRFIGDFYSLDEAVQVALRPTVVIEYTAPPAAGEVTVTTNSSSSVEETTATMHGDIINGINVDMRGFAYGTTTNATLPGNEEPPASYTSNWTEEGSFGTGAFDSVGNITGLTPATTYYFRSYAHNATGWGWGGELNFLTKPNPPTNLVCTPGDTQIAYTWTNAAGGAGVSVNTTLRYEIGSYPTDLGDGTLTYNGTGVAHTATGLTNGLVYYTRAWSDIADGQGNSQYSDTYDQCIATPVPPPTVLTLFCSGFGEDWAIVNAEVTYAPYAITGRGFDYGLTTAYGDEWTESGSWGTGTFSATLTSLNPATVYHYRAKVSVSGSWFYGEDRVFSTKGSPVLYEFWDTGGDGDNIDIYGANWTYQTFTTNTTNVAHTVTSVWLYLQRVGSPGTISVGIKNTANATAGQTCWTYPTGDDITSGTLDGDTLGITHTWYEVEMSPEVCLSANTTYSIVVSALAGDSSNLVQWRWDAGGGYSGGNAGHSNDSGSTWTNDCPADHLFQIWGEPCLEVLDAKVFTTYINNGDWLITCRYKNLYDLYEDIDGVLPLFYLQLMDGSTVKAQNRCIDGGYKPGSIYLSSDMVASLEWGYAYTVRLYGDFGTNPYMEYALQPADWQGSDLTRLDAWVRGCAILMEEYYGTAFTVYISGKGIVLNEDGGVIFSTNIPELDAVRPGMFQIVTTTPGFDEGEFTHAYADSLAWQTFMGEQLTTAFTSVGNIVGLSGSTIGALLAFLIYAAVALLAFPAGHAIAAIVLPSPLLIVVWGTGLAEMALMGTLLAVSVILLVWQFWWKGA